MTIMATLYIYIEDYEVVKFFVITHDMILNGLHLKWQHINPNFVASMKKSTWSLIANIPISDCKILEGKFFRGKEVKDYIMEKFPELWL